MPDKIHPRGSPLTTPDGRVGSDQATSPWPSRRRRWRAASQGRQPLETGGATVPFPQDHALVARCTDSAGRPTRSSWPSASPSREGMTNPRRVLTSPPPRATVLASGYGPGRTPRACGPVRGLPALRRKLTWTRCQPPKRGRGVLPRSRAACPNIMILLDTRGRCGASRRTVSGFLGGTAPPSGKENAVAGTPHRTGTMLSAVANRVYSSPCGASTPRSHRPPFDPARTTRWERAFAPSGPTPERPREPRLTTRMVLVERTRRHGDHLQRARGTCSRRNLVSTTSSSTRRRRRSADG